MTGSDPLRPVRRFGDGALLAELDSTSDAHGLATALSGPSAQRGVEDVVVGHRSVLVVADPTSADLAALEHELAHHAPGASAPSATRRIEVPVCFDGPDLDEVAAATSMARAELVGALLEVRLTVAFLGFLPGFAYLEGLPPALAAVARRSSPRVSVPAGSLALGGGFAGIYPQVSPGGWQLVGHTGFELFDPDVEPFAVLAPGDTVGLRAVDDPGTARDRARPPLRSDAACTVVVEVPGLLSTVQDLGRIGVARLGVPRAGAADPYSLRAANRLVGNADDAGALEVTARGPVLRFAGPAHVAVVGRAELRVDGLAAPIDTVVPVAAGQELSVGAVLDDLRCYLAVSGGFDLPPVLGSRSSDVLTGLGPGALRAGDVLGVGPPGRPRGRLERRDRADPPPTRPVLRVIPGPDHLTTDAAERLAAGAWEVGPASDRMGVRLHGDGGSEPDRSLPRGPGVASRGMVTGAVQVPPDGDPVVLLCDHATVGGYPVVATVVQADLGVLGQLRPGQSVRFELVDQAEADRGRLMAQRALDRAVVGWFPVRTD